MDTEKLEEILEILREQGVSRFECSEFSVVMGDAPVVAESSDGPGVGELIRTRPREETYAKGIYSQSALWHGGAPILFPKKSDQ